METYGEKTILNKSKKILLLSLLDELRRKMSVAKIGKNIEELTDDEKTKLNKLIHYIENKLNIHDLVIHIVEGSKLTSSEISAIEQLQNPIGNNGYGVDINKLISNIYINSATISNIASISNLSIERNNNNRNRIINRVQKERIAKLKAQIPVGIETHKKINTTISMIERKKSSTKRNNKIVKLICGNFWYIALDSNGNIVDKYHDELNDIYGVEKEIYEKTLIEYVAKEQQNLTYHQ